MRRVTRAIAPTLLLLAAATVWTTTSARVVTAAGEGYHPLDAPQRLLETRPGEVTADGRFAGGGAIRSGRTLAVDVAGRAGLPDDPGSVVLNITATGADERGFAVAWPCDEDRPPTASLNFAPDQTIANTVIARVAADGTVCFFARSTVHLVVDAAGHLPDDSFDPLPAPERLADTRVGTDTVDGAHRGDGRRAAGSTYAVQVAGRGSLPDGATAAVLNVTVTGPADRGFLTIFPCTAERPLAANLTFAPGQTIANAVLTRLDEDGRVCIFTRAATDLVVDATGTLPESVFRALDAPRRLVDTRPGEITADQRYQGGGRQPAFGTMQLAVAGRVGIPDEVSAVVLNVTSTGSTERGFVTVHPQGSNRPTAANLNYPAGVNVSNVVVAAVGGSGDVCVFTRGSTDLVVDVVGWVTGPAVDTGDEACPGHGDALDIETLRTTYVRRPALHQVVGTDTIAVFVCTVPPNSTAYSSPVRHDVTPQSAAAFLNEHVTPYYDTVSNGRYAVRFVAAGTISLSASDGPSQCRAQASSRAGSPYTGAIGIDDTESSGGFAGPGYIYPYPSPGGDQSVLAGIANQTSRGGWLGGGNVSTRPNPAAFIHELGHMLHWPHSFIGPGFEYDNWVDVMSRGQGWCTVPGGTSRYNCDPANTMAFNRFAAGWLGAGDVVVHDGGTVNYLLDKPMGDGVQMVMLPDAAEPLSMMTIEARPAVGNDDFFEREGVAIHVVDQVARSSSPFSGISTGRRHRQAMGEPNTYDHVVEVGDQVTVHGVTIRVIERTGDRYVTQISGSYRMPGAAFFAESGATAALTHDLDTVH